MNDSKDDRPGLRTWEQVCQAAADKENRQEASSPAPTEPAAPKPRTMEELCEREAAKVY